MIVKNKGSFKDMKKYVQSGRSMIEMLGVLAIVGVLSVGGITGYNMAMQAYKTNQLIEKLQLISTTVRSLCRSKYANVSADVMTDTGKLKAEDFQNPFGGTLTLGSWRDGNYFYISIPNLPAGTCSDIAVADWGNENVFYGVQLAVMLSYENGYYPTDTNLAITYCKGADKAVGLYFK